MYTHPNTRDHNKSPNIAENHTCNSVIRNFITFFCISAFDAAALNNNNNNNKPLES
jgi:hypothetical protein